MPIPKSRKAYRELLAERNTPEELALSQRLKAFLERPPSTWTRSEARKPGRLHGTLRPLPGLDAPTAKRKRQLGKRTSDNSCVAQSRRVHEVHPAFWRGGVASELGVLQNP